jgi:capsular polysaccharide export protein
VSKLSFLGVLDGKRVLLLQGPNGPFFARLAKMLEGQGALVTKVNFNGGDYVFFPTAARAFRGEMREWPEYCARLVDEGGFDWVLLFGDCRPIHRTAIEIARARGVRIGVFEEGYVRPNFVTFEEDGVNAYSSVPKEPRFFRAIEPQPIPAVPDVRNAFWYSVLWSAVYHTAASVGRVVPFRRYRHHRKLGIPEMMPWIRGAARKYVYRRRERGIQEELTTTWAKRWFLVPLQVHNDAQVQVHSDYESVAEFVREVIRSFAAHAPADTRLVIKHHPLDRGYNDYAPLIAREATEHGVEGRVSYIHDQHLPSLLDATRGVVVINSTAGLQALDHRAPVKVCGRAVYDLDGLTFRGSLDEFWSATEAFRMDAELFSTFKSWLVRQTQLGGSFYRELESGALLQELGRHTLEGLERPTVTVEPSAPFAVMSAAE